MVELFNIYYANRIIEVYRYKKNLIECSQLDRELCRLNYLYDIQDWVQEKDWDRYLDNIKVFLNLTNYPVIESEPSVSPL